MRYSNEHKGRTRSTVLKKTSARIGKQGFDGFSVVDVMRDAGRTHGGFYAHFRSRDELIGSAVAATLEQSVKRWQGKTDGAAGASDLGPAISRYLSADHRADLGDGCAFAALAMDVTRGNASLRVEFSERLNELIDILTARLPGSASQDSRERAITLFSLLAGALMLSRAVSGRDFSNEVLAVARRASLSMISVRPRGSRRTKGR